MEKKVTITYETNTESLKKADDDITKHQAKLKQTQDQLAQLEQQGKSTAGKLSESIGLIQGGYNTVKDLGTPGNLFDKKFNELRALLKSSGKSSEDFLHDLQKQTNYEFSRVDLLQKAIELRKKGGSIDEISRIIASSEETAANSTKEIDQLDSSWNNLLSSFGAMSTFVIKGTTIGLLTGRKVIEAVKFGLTQNYQTFNENDEEINNNIRSVLLGGDKQPKTLFPRMMSPREANFPRPITTHNYRNQQQESSQSVDPRTLPNAEVNPIAVKKAGDVVGLINTQMQAAKFATVELSKSFQQTGQQGGKSFIELINLSGKLKNTLASGLDVVSQKIQQGVHNIFRWSPSWIWAPSS